MLPKIHRLDKKTLEEVFKSGRFVNTGSLTLKFILKKGSFTRISFIVPKTVSKKAVVRNQLRRRGYSLLNIKDLKEGTIGVFVFGKKSEELFYGRKTKEKDPIGNLKQEIETIISKIH